MGVRKLSELQVIPQVRDIKLFERLCDFGYLSSNQIAKCVFKVKQPVALVRLWRLKSAGYLNFAPKKAMDGSSIYTLNISSMSGYLSPELLNRGRKSSYSGVWKRTQTVHEETSREIALRILSFMPEVSIDMDHLLSQSDWLGDYNEKNSSKKVPDFILRIGKRPIGVFEIELSQKARSRYFKIFNRLILNSRCPVIYICANQTIANCVQQNYLKVSQFLSVKSGITPPKLIVKRLDEVATNENLEVLISELMSEELK